MAEASDSDVPVIVEGQTTSVAEGAEASQEQPPISSESGNGGDGTNFFQGPYFWGLLLIWVLWFWYSSKNRKKQKTERERLQTFQKGDKIITIGRMHGIIVAFTDETVTIKPDDKANYTMTFDRQAIYRLIPKNAEAVADAATK